MAIIQSIRDHYVAGFFMLFFALEKKPQLTTKTQLQPILEEHEVDKFTSQISIQIEKTEQLLALRKHRKSWCTSQLEPVADVLLHLRKRGKSFRFMQMHLVTHHDINVAHSTISKYLEKLTRLDKLED